MMPSGSFKRTVLIGAGSAGEEVRTRQVSPQRPSAIWDFVSEDSFDAADRLLEEFYRTFQQVAEAPGIGHKARTSLKERFSSGACTRI